MSPNWLRYRCRRRRTRPRQCQPLVLCNQRLCIRTAIPARRQANYRWPDERKRKRNGAIVEVVDAARDLINHVPTLLVEDVGGHRKERNHNTEQYLHATIAPALLLIRNQGGTSGIQHPSQTAEHAQQPSGDRNVTSNHDFDLKVANTSAIPPRVGIIARPNEGIDDVEEVE